MLVSVGGKRVPFNPRRFPIRLSPLRSGGVVENECVRGRSNCGLLTAGKTSICPSGEQITNPDFETGDLTGWTPSGTITIESIHPHSGVYTCCFWELYASVTQDIQSLKGYAVPVKCITICKTWLYGGYCPHADFDVIITYSDNTTTTVSITDIDDSWHECDILPYLDTTKSVKSIQIIAGDYPTFLDDVSLLC